MTQPPADDLVEHSRSDIAYVDGLEAHMGEGGQYSAKNVSDLIAMVRWNANQFMEAAAELTRLRAMCDELAGAVEPLVKAWDGFRSDDCDGNQQDAYYRLAKGQWENWDRARTAYAKYQQEQGL